MTTQDIIQYRLINQQLLHSDFTEVDALVRWMGCIQAQDFAGAKWAIGSRVPNSTEALVDKCFNAGEILRTHVLRPTWHFILPQDIRWMLKLSAPKIKAMSKGQHQKLNIDDKVLKRSKALIEKAFKKEKHLTRDALKECLTAGKINTDDIRLALIIMDAELEGLLCSGPRKGKQFTYALLDERVPQVKAIEHDAAIAELGKRYFLSRGPATLRDFSWWSGLTLVEAKKSIDMNKKHLSSAAIEGVTYCFSADLPDRKKPAATVHLLPSFDEYAVAYKDRSRILDASFSEQTGNGIFKSTVVIDGKIKGIWKRVENKEGVHVELTPFDRWKKPVQAQVRHVAEAFARFLNKELV